LLVRSPCGWYGDRQPPSGKCELYIEADDEAGETNLPSVEVLAVVSRVLAEQARLVTAATPALWDDFNGRGTPSGMW
jgi:hypothetical protein